MNLLWIDLEMTGLDFNCDHILEIACICTNTNLDVLFSYHEIIYQSLDVLNAMSKYCYDMHRVSGLYDKVLKSDKTYNKIENAIISLLEKYTMQNNTYIAGNSVYNDLIFIKQYMPKISSWIHYRTFDISTLKLIAQIKNIPPFFKLKKHTALSDICESIEEYKYYQKNLLI